MSPVNQSVSQLLGTVLVLLAIVCCNLAEGVDLEAKAKCAQLHSGTIRDQSAFFNQYCYLSCYVNNTAISHNLNEGMRCPSADSDSYICKNGVCVDAPVSTGQIRLKIVSASLSTPINGYATACLINTTQTIHLPLRNRSACVDCVTRKDVSTANPAWNFECGSFQNHLFPSESSLALELWNHRSNMQNQYQGGAIINLPKLGNNEYKELDFYSKLEGNILNGTIKTNLRWTGEKWMK